MWQTVPWQTKWNQDATGFYTRHLIPEVGTKVTFPEKRDVGISYCRLLLHDTLLRDDAYRTGISHTPVCECGVEIQTADHFLLRCNRHQDARHKLKNVVENMLIQCTVMHCISMSRPYTFAWKSTVGNQMQWRYQKAKHSNKVSSLPCSSSLTHSWSSSFSHQIRCHISVCYFQHCVILWSSTFEQNFTVKSNTCDPVLPE